MAVRYLVRKMNINDTIRERLRPNYWDSLGRKEIRWRDLYNSIIPTYSPKCQSGFAQEHQIHSQPHSVQLQRFVFQKWNLFLWWLYFIEEGNYSGIHMYFETEKVEIKTEYWQMEIAKLKTKRYFLKYRTFKKQMQQLHLKMGTKSDFVWTLEIEYGNIFWTFYFFIYAKPAAWNVTFLLTPPLTYCTRITRFQKRPWHVFLRLNASCVMWRKIIDNWNYNLEREMTFIWTAHVWYSCAFHFLCMDGA